MARRFCLVAFCLLLASQLSAQPRVRQFDPPSTLLLGEPVYWILEVRHPISETYDLTVQAPPGAMMQVEGRTDRRNGQEMITVYRVRITAVELAVGGQPAAIVTGTGGAVAVRCRLLQLYAISRDSVELRNPASPHFPAPRSPWMYRAGEAAIVLLWFAWIGVRLRRWHSTKPRQVLLRQLQETLSKARRPSDPAAMSRLFRSELLWGGPVDAATVAELRERAGTHPQLAELSLAVERFESARYSGASLRDPALVERSVRAAMEVLQQR